MEYRVHIYRSERAGQGQFTYGDITSVDESGKGRTANLTERATGRLGEILSAAMTGDQLSDIAADSFVLNAHLYRLILPTDRNVIARLEAASPFDLTREAMPATWGIPGQAADRLREILNAAIGGDNLDRYFSVPADSWRREFDRGWEIGIADFLNELRASEQTDAIGRAVWEAWHSGMVTQGRKVAIERQDWDTLPPDDQQLDRAIGTIVIQRLAIVCAENARANRSMREHMGDPIWLSEIEHMRVPVAPMSEPIAFSVQAQPDTSDDRPRTASVHEAMQGLFSSEGKPAMITGSLAGSEVVGNPIAEQEALIASLRAKLERKGQRASVHFRRLTAERDKIDHVLNGLIELRDVEIAYHKERAVNVTTRLEATQLALSTVGSLVIDRVVQDARTGDPAEVAELRIERDRQAQEIATLKEALALSGRANQLLHEDAAKRTAEIDTLRDELTRARLITRSAGASTEFDLFMGRAALPNIHDALTYNLAEMSGEVAAVSKAVRGLTGEDAAQITNRLVTIAARAFAVHQLRGKAIGGNPPPAFVKSPVPFGYVVPDQMRHSAPLASGLPTRIGWLGDLTAYSLVEHDAHWTLYMDTYTQGEARGEATIRRIMPETAEAIRRIMGKPALLNELYHVRESDMGDWSTFIASMPAYRVEVGREMGELAAPGILPNVAREDTEGTADGSERTDLAGLPLDSTDGYGDDSGKMRRPLADE